MSFEFFADLFLDFFANSFLEFLADLPLEIFSDLPLEFFSDLYLEFPADFYAVFFQICVSIYAAYERPLIGTMVGLICTYLTYALLPIRLKDALLAGAVLAVTHLSGLTYMELSWNHVRTLITQGVINILVRGCFERWLYN